MYTHTTAYYLVIALMYHWIEEIFLKVYLHLYLDDEPTILIFFMSLRSSSFKKISDPSLAHIGFSFGYKYLIIFSACPK